MTGLQFKDWLKDNISVNKLCAIRVYIMYQKNPDGYCDDIDSFFDRLSQRDDTRTSLFTKYIPGRVNIDDIKERCSWNGYELDEYGAYANHNFYRLRVSAYANSIVELYADTEEDILDTVVDIIKRRVTLSHYDDPLEVLQVLITNL